MNDKKNQDDSKRQTKAPKVSYHGESDEKEHFGRPWTSWDRQSKDRKLSCVL